MLQALPDVRKFSQEIIMEWYEAYINFYSLQDMIKQVVTIYLDNHQQVFTNNHEKLIYHPLPPTHPQAQILKIAYEATHKVNFIGLMKARAFLDYMKFQIAQQCLELELILDEMSMIEIITHDVCVRRHKIKQIIKDIFITVHHLRQFAILNEKIYEDVVQCVDRYALPFILDTQNTNARVLVRRGESFLQHIEPSTHDILHNIKMMEKKVPSIDEIEGNDENQSQHSFQKSQSDYNSLYLSNFLIKHRRTVEQQKSQLTSSLLGQINSSRVSHKSWNLHEQTSFLLHIEQKMKLMYSKLVFFNERKTNQLDVLVDIRHKITTDKTYIFAGFYCGVSLVCFLAIFLLLLFDLISIGEVEGNVDSFKFIFPMFRGVGILILYLWGLSWNIYGFNRFRISYRRILEYGSHYSTAPIMIKRASFFTLIYFCMLLLYFIGATYNKNRQENSDRVPIEYTPFIVWVVYLGYIFFPNRNVFNPRGRKYFYRVINDVLKTPCGHMCFLYSWVTDQSVSFVIPIKDMGYTICFYTSDFSDGHSQSIENNCLDKRALQTFIFTYVIALLPLIFRMLQCYRQAKQDTGVFFNHTQMWNFGKYMTATLTATLSFISGFNDKMFVPMIVCSITSTLYAYYWDLKHDWGFLEKNTNFIFLRNHLSYKRPTYYYLAIGFNLLFRLSWTLSISPYVINHTPTPMIPLLIGFIEIIRRCMWNFFRIQKQHIVNCRNYSVSNNIQKQLKKLKNLNQIQNLATDHETLPYFVNSKQTQIHEVDIVPKDYVKKIKQQNTNQLHATFSQFLQKEKYEISQFFNQIKKIS